MKIRFNLLALSSLYCTGFATAAVAETITCPSLASAVQIATCPAEEEIKFTYSGYCSDNARMYDKPDDQLCTNYALYRSMKNNALWEAGEGRFSGYVSCEPGIKPPGQAKVVSVKLGKQGSVSRMICSYDTGLTFSYRTKATCAIAAGDAEQCASDVAACRASCE